MSEIYRFNRPDCEPPVHVFLPYESPEPDPGEIQRGSEMWCLAIEAALEAARDQEYRRKQEVAKLQAKLTEYKSELRGAYRSMRALGIRATNPGHWQDPAATDGSLNDTLEDAVVS